VETLQAHGSAAMPYAYEAVTIPALGDVA